MISIAASYFFAVAALALAAAVGYGLSVGERSGTLLFGFAFLGALVAGLGAVGAGTRDAPVPEGEPAPAAPDVARPSPWPLGLGVVGALWALSAYAGAGMTVVAGVTTTVVLLAWLAQAWREHPRWTPRLDQRMDTRVVAPVLLPVGAFVVAVAVAIAFSRVFLAISREAAAVVALLLASAILAACFMVAARPRLRSSALVGVAVLAGAAALAGGVVGAVAGEREFEHHGEHGTVIELVAENIQFDTDRIEIPADEEHVEVDFVNHDEEFHNLAVYTEEGPQGEPIFNGRPITEGHISYDLTDEVPDPGSYFFVCDFHPNMTGELVVE